jgi:hypothetical protein
MGDVALVERRAYCIACRTRTPEIKKSQLDVDMNSNPCQLGAVLCVFAKDEVAPDSSYFSLSLLSSFFKT